MTPQQKANWIRRLFTLVILGGGGAAGIFFALPDGWLSKISAAGKDDSLKVTEENILEIQNTPGKLVVTNMMLDCNPDSKKLKKLLKKLQEEKYGERIVVAELDIDDHPKLAAEQGVDTKTLEEFAGHLNFHAEGRKLGDLIDETDPVIVEKTIDRMLEGMVQRIDKNWLPEVPGMQRDTGQDILKIKRSPASN